MALGWDLVGLPHWHGQARRLIGPSDCYLTNTAPSMIWNEMREDATNGSGTVVHAGRRDGPAAPLSKAGHDVDIKGSAAAT